MDRRTRKRDARRDHLLDLAAELSERQGVNGVTMAALAEAADYAPASLYTYFASRSALLAALQQRALATLRQVTADALAAWDATVADLADAPTPVVASLSRLWVFADLFLAAPIHHPREFRLQQQLLATPNTQDTTDAATVVPAAMGVLDLPRRLLAEAASGGALEPHRPTSDPLDQPLDSDLLRTLVWVTALNGGLLLDALGTGVPTTGSALGAELTESLLRGWGAEPEALQLARRLTHGWVCDNADRKER